MGGDEGEGSVPNEIFFSEEEVDLEMTPEMGCLLLCGRYEN